MAHPIYLNPQLCLCERIYVPVIVALSHADCLTLSFFLSLSLSLWLHSASRFTHYPSHHRQKVRSWCCLKIRQCSGQRCYLGTGFCGNSMSIYCKFDNNLVAVLARAGQCLRIGKVKYVNELGEYLVWVLGKKQTGMLRDNFLISHF